MCLENCVIGAAYACMLPTLTTGREEDTESSSGSDSDESDVEGSNDQTRDGEEGAAKQDGEDDSSGSNSESSRDSEEEGAEDNHVQVREHMSGDEESLSSHLVHLYDLKEPMKFMLVFEECQCRTIKGR